MRCGREVLENIPFPIGYGVETAHLLDVYNMYGIVAFAQVDLDQRVHRNQQITALSRMSFGILQTFFSRLQRFGILETREALLTVFRRVQVNEQQFQMMAQTILEDERPPMLEIPEYLAKFPQRRPGV